MHGKMLDELKLCLYGTQDAAKGWQETLSAHLEALGLRRGKGHPCVFHHPSRDIKTLAHGDDYVSAGSDESMHWLEAELAEAYEIQTQKLGESKGQKEEGKVLNRISSLVRYRCSLHMRSILNHARSMYSAICTRICARHLRTHVTTVTCTRMYIR